MRTEKAVNDKVFTPILTLQSAELELVAVAYCEKDFIFRSSLQKRYKIIKDHLRIVRSWRSGTASQWLKCTNSNVGVVGSNPARFIKRTTSGRKVTGNNSIQSASLDISRNLFYGFCYARNLVLIL